MGGGKISGTMRGDGQEGCRELTLCQELENYGKAEVEETVVQTWAHE